MRKRVKKLLHNDEKCVTIKALYVNLLLGGIRIMATFYASKTGEVSAREKEHSALVRELAALTNDDVTCFASFATKYLNA